MYVGQKLIQKTKGQDNDTLRLAKKIVKTCSKATSLNVVTRGRPGIYGKPILSDAKSAV